MNDDRVRETVGEPFTVRKSTLRGRLELVVVNRKP